MGAGPVGLLLTTLLQTRFVCKVKMSQDKDEQSQAQVVAELRGAGFYANAALAADMERALSDG
jgi:transcriptional regulator